MLFKVLFLVALSLAIFWGAANSETQEKGVEKRKGNGNTPAISLADVAKRLDVALKKIKKLESQVKVCSTSQSSSGSALVKVFCSACKAGPPGAPGKPGKSGARGPRGSQGVRGPAGKDGKSGARGPRGLQGVRGPAGVQYVRWGRTTCPTGATLVYKGRAGGEWYDNTGGGSNYVCLTESPKYANFSTSYHDERAHMYGAEYQEEEVPRKGLYQRDVPCAVCYVQTRSTKLIIPATFACPAGWTREFWGYLFAARRDHTNQKGFVCVDKDAEVVPGSVKNDNGALFYSVEGRCGSLPCPPYVNKRDLTCAVCTK